MNDAKKILLKSFKRINVNGRYVYPEISDEEFAICKEQGFMFDPPKDEGHDEFMFRLRNILKEIDPQYVSNAFLYSLSTSTIASYPLLFACLISSTILNRSPRYSLILIR